MAQLVQFPTVLSDRDRAAVLSHVSQRRAFAYHVDFWTNEATREHGVTVSPDETALGFNASVGAISFFPDPYNRPHWVAVRLGDAVSRGRSVAEIIERDGCWLLP